MLILSFDARAALAEFRATRSIERLRTALNRNPNDYDAASARGETLLDIAYRTDRKAAAALLQLGAYRTLH